MGIDPLNSVRKHFWIGIAVTISFAYLAFRDIHFQDIGAALSKANPLLILAALVIYVLDFYTRALRWSCILAPLRPVRALQILGILMVGFFANNILPFRMGELARAHFCAKKLSLSRASTLGTIVIERLCDMVSFLLVFLLASSALPFPAYMKQGALMMGMACLFVFLAILFMHFQRSRFEKILHQTPIPKAWKEKVWSLTDHFTKSTIGILSPSVLFKALSLSIIIWTAEAGFLYSIAHALALPLTPMGAFFLLFALGLSVSLPQGPGYVGTFEYFGMTALVLLGFPKEVGLPVILAIHGLQFTMCFTGGLFGLWKEKISFQNLSTSS